jgi:predicted GIY-YIG superfamily endonuclease
MSEERKVSSAGNSGKIADYLGTSKDKEIDKSKKSKVYLLTCNDCDSKYIGMTKRQIRKRFSEHQADCLKPLNQDSAIAFHCITEKHTIKNEVVLLKEVDEPHKLSVWESLNLFKNRNENLTNIFKEGNSPSILFECI